jgi:hypothetical protein
MVKEMTVNEIFQRYGEDYRKLNPFLSIHEKKIMRAIEVCRTETLGGRIEVCDHCGNTVKLFHSCRNRHCPQCQFMKKEQWIESKKREIFPFQYFHVVFTLPDKLDQIVLRNKKKIYKLLFDKVKETLLSVSNEKKYFGAKIGFFSILHTWGQKLNLHPHLHCVVPGGGYSEKEKRWIKSPKNYLFPIEVLKRRFRSLFLVELKKMYKNGELYLTGTNYSEPKIFYKLIDDLFMTNWVIYLKESFQNSDSVIAYLARYTHRIAISNNRIVKVEDEKVFFSYKDYKENNQKKVMSLPVMEFIKRFLWHIVPSRFVRIRYYGLLANRNKKTNLEKCYEYFELEQRIEEITKDWDTIYFEVTGIDLHKCPECEEGNMVCLDKIDKNLYRPPPAA